MTNKLMYGIIKPLYRTYVYFTITLLKIQMNEFVSKASIFSRCWIVSLR